METSKSLHVLHVRIHDVAILLKRHFWRWRVQDQVTRQNGEYKICLASMKSKSLANLASMISSLCRTLLYQCLSMSD